MVLDGGESLTLGNIRFIPSKEIFITNLLETVFMWIQKKIIKINSCYASVFENTTQFQKLPYFFVDEKVVRHLYCRFQQTEQIIVGETASDENQISISPWTDIAQFTGFVRNFERPIEAFYFMIQC